MLKGLLFSPLLLHFHSYKAATQIIIRNPSQIYCFKRVQASILIVLWKNMALKWQRIQTGIHTKGALFSSVGRAGHPCTEALSSLQQTQVRFLAWIPLSQPVSCHIFNCPVNKAKRLKKKQLHCSSYPWLASTEDANTFGPTNTGLVTTQHCSVYD